MANWKFFTQQVRLWDFGLKYFLTSSKIVVLIEKIKLTDFL